MGEVHNGLEGVVAAETRLSMVDGERGVLVLCGKRIEDIAAKNTFEETVELLWTCAGFEDATRAVALLPHSHTLPRYTIDLLAAAARDRVDLMDALRMGAASLSANDDREA